jgi:hypothetical protein
MKMMRTSSTTTTRKTTTKRIDQFVAEPILDRASRHEIAALVGMGAARANGRLL